MLTVITEPAEYSPKALSTYASLGEVECGSTLTRKKMLERVAQADVLVIRLALQIDREVIEAGVNLKAIVSPTTGLDHIDVEAAASKGVEVLSLNGELEFLQSIPATAEHTWALILALSRRLPWAFNAVCEGRWKDNRLRQEFRGHDLSGQKLGIIGLGRVGSKVTRFGLAFGMEVSAFDPFQNRWVDGVNKETSLQGLASDVDFLSLHVPLSTDTEGMIEERIFSIMPRGSSFINTSRGAIVDELAMLEALESGQLAGAAIDVISDEIKSERSISEKLFAYASKSDNLIITPHIAGATVESMYSTEEFVAGKLLAFFNS